MISRELPRDDLDRVASWGGSDWDHLRGARVFLTGGTGFIGTWMLGAAIHATEIRGLDTRFVALSRDPERFRVRFPSIANHPRVSLLAGDVRTFPIPQERFTHAIHAATDASATMNLERPMEMIDTIVGGTRHVLDAAIAMGCQRVLFVSSGAVYGKQPSSITSVSEEYMGGPDPLHPTSAYGEGKRLAEQVCAAFSRLHGIDVAIARCWAFIGPLLPLDAHFAAGNLISDGLRGGPLLIKGDGTTVRSYLYAADLAAWLWRIALRGAVLRAYNVGSDVAVTIRELAEAVGRACGGAFDVQIAQSVKPGYHVDRYVPDITRARNELGLEIFTPLDRALASTIAWHRNGDAAFPARAAGTMT